MSARPCPLPKTKRLGVHACGLAIVLSIPAAGYLLALRPLHNSTTELADERMRLQATIASADAIDQRTDQLQGSIAATRQRLDDLLGQLPDGPSTEQLMATIAAAAQVASAEVLSLQPMPPRDGQDAAVQTIKLRLRCNHAGLCRFLAALNSGSVAVWVATAELRAEAVDAVGRGGGIRTAELTLRVPHAAEKTLAGNLKRKLPIIEPDA